MSETEYAKQLRMLQGICSRSDVHIRKNRTGKNRSMLVINGPNVPILKMLLILTREKITT